MEINKNNYEAYFLDFAEGNLSTSLQKELDLFLIENPELKLELEDFELLKLEDEKVSNEALKAKLIRDESTGLTEQDYLLISEVEGTITSEEKAKLDTLLVGNPSIKNDLIAYQKTKLSNQDYITFPNKSTLIRKQGKVIYFFRYAAATAAAILAFVWFNTGSVDKQYTPRTAQKIVLETGSDEALQLANVVVKDSLTKSIEKGKTQVPTMELVAPETNFAQLEETPPEIIPVIEKTIKENQKEVINPVLEEPEITFAAKPIEEKKQEEHIVPNNEGQLASTERPSSNKDEFIPLNEFAKKAILKDKTVSETISEELAQISNDKINFESVKNKQGEVEQFALNIGRFSISRKK